MINGGLCIGQIKEKDSGRVGNMGDQIMYRLGPSGNKVWENKKG